ncbi:MAG TPA: DUF2970 domain-containing protein [Burkholderiales bacterium]|nr:DUF2970 domain-containing protein [Burkholderiales bacterium]
MAQTERSDQKAKRAGPLQVAKAVFWSFFGVRRSKDHDADAASLTPVQVIVAGIIGAALFVFVLIMVVRLVTS